MSASVTSSTSGDDGYRVPAVERTFIILKLLAAHGAMSLAEVVDGSGLNKSTTFYILRTLVTLDVVSYDDSKRTYALGPTLMQLGLTASTQVSDVEIAKRDLAELLDLFNVTVVLYRRVGLGEVMIVDKIERSHRVRITVQIGTHLPIQGASFGRAFLAFDSPEAIKHALSDGLHKFTEKSITRVADFRRDLAEVRRRGWALDEEGFALGVSTVAAPIFGPDGSVALVAAAVGFSSLMTPEVVDKCGRALRGMCDSIGTALGGVTPHWSDPQ